MFDNDAILMDFRYPLLTYTSLSLSLSLSIYLSLSQFTSPKEVVSPIRNATTDVLGCHVDMTDGEMNKLKGVYGINVVPATNPDVVPALVVRDVEEVDPVCVAACTATTTDSSVSTAGYCRLATTDKDVAVCAAPIPIHTVSWANPLLSGKQYDSATVSGARPGEYIAFEWDDAVHDVWLVPDATSSSSSAWNPCDETGAGSGATLLIPQSHHATFDPTTNLRVPGRNLYVGDTKYGLPYRRARLRLRVHLVIQGQCTAVHVHLSLWVLLE